MIIGCVPDTTSCKILLNIVSERIILIVIYLKFFEGGGAGTQSSEESPESSEDDLYQGGAGVNSGERQCERVCQLGQTVRSPITTLLGHAGVVISCGT